MKIKIRDWDTHFERDRTKQWKHLEWVPIPNKQGSGFRKIMKQPNGLEIFSCWIVLVEVASTCTPRGDLSKYNLDDLSDLCMINGEKLIVGIKYLSEVLDWIEIIENLDTTVKNIDVDGQRNCDSSSILFNSIQSNSIQDSDARKILDKPKKEKKNIEPPSFEDVKAYCDERKNSVNAQDFIDYYEARGWMLGKTRMKKWQAAIRTWEKNSFQNRQTDRTEGRYANL